MPADYDIFYLDYRFVKERHDFLGGDLSAAHFMVARGGAVKFVGFTRWITLVNNTVPLPSAPNDKMKLEGVDATGTNFMHRSLDNFGNSHSLHCILLVWSLKVNCVLFQLDWSI